MTYTISQRDRLDDVRSRAKDLRDRRAKARKFRDEARQAANDYSGNEAIEQTEEFRRLERAVGDLDQIGEQLVLVEEEERYVLSAMAGVDGGLHRESFLSSPNVLEELRVRAESSERFGDLVLGQVKSRDELVADFQDRRQRLAAAGDVVLPSDASRTRYYAPPFMPLTRPIRLLDLIPSAAMDAGSYDILVESYAPGAAETAELQIKPTGQVTLVDQTIKAFTIAVWGHMSRQTMADVGGLYATVEELLRWDVEQKLELQILSGAGGTTAILGILNTSGIGATASGVGDSVNSDLVANAKRDVRLSNAQPEAILMNPTDVTKALKVKASGSGERLDSDGAFGVVPTQMWGLNLVETPAIAAGTALVGDFARGCQLWIREAINARVSDADQDDFVRNAIKVLLEGRFAFAVVRPAAFSKVTLAFAN
jgi:hypothetical protein